MAADETTSRLEPRTREFYIQALDVLLGSEVSFMLGGAYAFACYTGIERHTKDLDIFLRPEDRDRALAAFHKAGYETEVRAEHWLAKAHCGDDFVDFIYNSGNGVARVDDLWFQYAPTAEVLGRRVLLTPVEEMLWSKAFVMERERYDGADVMHLIRARGHEMDWSRVMARFRPHWRLLLSHLTLFTFVYPSERHQVPEAVLGELVDRMAMEGTRTASTRIAHGTLISSQQYLTDVNQWGYADAREQPLGPLTPREVEQWTEAVQHEA